MSAATETRLALAHRLAPFYDLPEVAAVAVSGSTARGLADDHSDLELGVYWHEPPTEAARARISEALGAQVRRRFTRPEVWFGVDNLTLDGFQVDIAMNTVRAIDETLRRSVDEADPGLEGHQLVAMLRELRPLSGVDQVRSWQGRITYSEALRDAMLERHLQITPAAGLRLDVARGDRFRVAERVVAWVRALTIGLFALDRTWFVGFKAARHRLHALQHRPDRLEERLAACFSEDLGVVEEAAIGLMGEVLARAGRDAGRFTAGTARCWSPAEVRRVASRG